MENSTHLTNFKNISFIMDQDGNIISMDQKDVIKPFVEKKDNTCNNIIKDFNFHEDIMNRVTTLEEQINNLNCQQNNQNIITDNEKSVKEKDIDEIKNKAKINASKRINKGKFITISELKKRLGIGDHYAYELVKTGEIEAYRFNGKRWSIPEHAIADYMKRCSNR